MRLDAGAGAGCNAAPLPSCRAPMSLLFSPISFGPLQLPNRIVIAPMCQYSAHDGCVSDWHPDQLAGPPRLWRGGAQRQTIAAAVLAISPWLYAQILRMR